MTPPTHDTPLEREGSGEASQSQPSGMGPSDLDAGRSAEEPAAPTPPPEPKRECRSCRWWDMHSLDLKAGDCRAPGDHRYSSVLVTSQRADGSEFHSYAMLDSFGPETTLPGFVCGVWDDGFREERAAIAKARGVDAGAHDASAKADSGTDQKGHLP